MKTKPYQPGKRVQKIIKFLESFHTDAETSKEFGVSRQAIQQIRKKLGLQPYKPELPFEIVQKLGTKSDSFLAKELHKSCLTISKWRRKHNIPAFASIKESKYKLIGKHPLFGKIPDVELARQLKVKYHVIAHARIKLGCQKNHPQRVNWTLDYLQLLGKMSDPKVQEISGIPLCVVFQKRKSLGIPAYKGSK